MTNGYFSYLYGNTAKNSGNAVYSLLEHNKNAVLLDCGCWSGENTKKFGNIIGTNLLHGIEIIKEKAMEAVKKSGLVQPEVISLREHFGWRSRSASGGSPNQPANFPIGGWTICHTRDLRQCFLRHRR